MRRTVVASVLGLLAPVMAERGDYSQIAHIQGVIASGGPLRVMAEFGPTAGHRVRIYSEPSHALLLETVDRDWAGTKSGRAWLEESRLALAAASVVTTIPASPAVEIRPRPAGDDRIAVWVEGGTGPAGVLVADGLVGPGAFAFSVSVPGEVGRGPWPTMLHCCSGGDCRQMCVSCKGTQFTCCPTWCEIFCEWAAPCCS